MAKKPEKGGDELDMLKASLLKKDLDVITITDKMRRLEDRSTYIVGSMEKLSVGAREKILTLTEIIDFLTNEGDTKDNRIAELEAACQKAEQDLKDNTAKMNKQMADLTSAHEFQLNSMKLKLEAAQVKIREMADFALKKKVIEDENAALKEQLLKEQRDHAEAISDVERVSVQEKERLKKEIQTRVEETKKEMSNTLKEQLHSVISYIFLWILTLKMLSNRRKTVLVILSLKKLYEKLV